MSIGQTSYNRNMAMGYPGMIEGLYDECESAMLDEAVGFGLGVVDGAETAAGTLSSKSVKLPDASTDTFRGITVHEHMENSYPYSSDGVTMPAGHVASIMRKGKVVVQTEGTVTVGSGTVYVTTAGKFTSTEGTNATATGCVFRRAETALNLALVEVNLP